MPPRKKKTADPSGVVDMSAPAGRAPGSGRRNVPDLDIPPPLGKTPSSRAKSGPLETNSRGETVGPSAFAAPRKLDLDDGDDLCALLEIVGPDWCHEIDELRGLVAELASAGALRTQFENERANAARGIMNIVSTRGLWNGFKTAEGSVSVQIPKPRRTIDESALRRALHSALSGVSEDYLAANLEQVMDDIVRDASREIPAGAPFVKWTPVKDPTASTGGPNDEA